MKTGHLGSTLGLWLLGLASVATVSACSCAPVPVDRLLEATAIAFLGTVEAVEKVPIGGDPSQVQWSHHFKVEKIYKGPVPPSATVRTDAMTPCGYSYPVGTRTVVFAEGSPGEFKAHLCGQPIHGRSNPERLAALLAKLPPGRDPDPEPAPPAVEPAPEPAPGWLGETPGEAVVPLDPASPHAQHDCCDYRHEPVPGHPCKRGVR